MTPWQVSDARLFHAADHFQSSDGEPVRAIVTESPHATIVAWRVNPGQRIAAHVHPHGQDSWTVLAGQGEYQLDAAGNTRTVRAGDIVVAHSGQVHGVFNAGDSPLLFVSVVCPAEAGFQLLAAVAG